MGLGQLATANLPQPTRCRTIQRGITQEMISQLQQTLLALGLNLFKLEVLKAGISCNSTCLSLELSHIELSCSE